MRWLKFGIWAFVCFGLLSACRSTTADITTNADVNSNSSTAIVESSNLPPFATKEPEKYSAKIVFSFRFEETAANFVEQIYLVARDGANRRLDFQIGENAIAKLQTADGKSFVLLPARKVYAEITAENSIPNFPDEFSLEQLLHTKPAGATFEKIGEEEITGRKTTKYKLDFGAVREVENARTETFVWADDTLGLPVKTEIIAMENNQPSGARNLVELREIKTEIEPQIFEIPKDFRKISVQEIQQILKK